MADGLEPGRGAQQEDAAVPEVAPAGNIVGGRGGVGLLAEGADGARGVGRRVTSADFCSRGLDIAVTGLGTIRNDAESDDRPGIGRRQAAQDRGLKRGGVADMVVRRRGQQHGIVAIAAGVEGGNSQRRSGVAAKRFKQQGPGREPEFAQLLGGDKAILFVADDDRRANWQSGQSLEGVLQQAVATDQGLQLLGMLFARNRPQARARAAAEDDGGNHIAHELKAEWRRRREQLWIIAHSQVARETRHAARSQLTVAVCHERSDRWWISPQLV
jgi:hypothetical protein